MHDIAALTSIRRMWRRTVLLALPGALLAMASAPATALAYQRVPRDTVTPHYGRWRDELPEMLAAAASVLQSGLGADARAIILAELRAVKPGQPIGRELPPRKSYSFTAGFRDRDVPVTLSMYWADTAGVAFRVRSPDLTLVDAVDSALYTARFSRLARPDTIRFTVGDGGGWSEGEPSRISIELAVPPAKHCPWFGLEHAADWRGDTLRFHIYGVAPPDRCPSGAFMRGSSYGPTTRAGTHVVAFDFRGDTDYVSLSVTDSSVALVPLRTTFVQAERTVKWRIPSASVLLECHPRGGDQRLCDALHTWVQRQPGVRPVVFPRGGISPLGSYSDGQRAALYRYPSEAVGAAVRRCIASIDKQLRLASWVKMRMRTTDGTWHLEHVYGTATIGGGQPAVIAAMLDETGNIPPRCGEAAPSLLVDAPSVTPAAPAPPRRSASTAAPRITAVSMFAYEQTNPTTVEARSDGWIVMTPLMSVWAPEPYPTTHLYARAGDALRWVERVRVALGAQADTTQGQRDSFVPHLGLGRVHVALDPALRPNTGTEVAFGLEDCTGLHHQYGIGRSAVLEIAGDVERAARIALAGSPVAVPPSVDQPYYSHEVSCRAMPHPANAHARFPDDVPAAERRLAEVGVRFVVDTAGRVQPGSMTILPGAPPSLVAATRALVAGWRYRGAEWGGVQVRQFVTTTVVFDPGALAATVAAPTAPSSISTATTTRATIKPFRMRQGGVFAWRYPLRVTVPASVVPRRIEVLASVVIDTAGVPDAATLVTMPGTEPRVDAALRGHVAEFRFTPATSAGMRVAERTTRVWLVEPEPHCLAEDAGPECPPDDGLLAGKTTPPIPVALLRPSAFYDIRAEVDPVNESEALPDALGLPSLTNTALPASVREIRIYTGLVVAYPHSALILREEGGRTGRVTGRLVQYWPRNEEKLGQTFDSEALNAASVAGRCDPPRRGTSAIACTVRFPRQPDWRALLRELDAVNAFDLPDEREVPSRGMTIDGWRLRVEARRGAGYRQYEYHNPDVYRPPEGPNALRVMSIVDSLFRFATPPRALQHVRGTYLYGRDTSDFVRCGRPEKPGLFQGQLGPIARFLGDSAWKAQGSPSRALEVEAWVRRRAMPEEARGRRYYPRTWQVDSVTAVRESRTRGC